MSAIEKVKLVHTSTSLTSCARCGGNDWEIWLEKQNGGTGIYCHKCGRRVGSGFNTGRNYDAKTFEKWRKIAEAKKQ